MNSEKRRYMNDVFYYAGRIWLKAQCNGLESVRPSVCLSVYPVGLLTETQQGKHSTRLAYISARQ